MQDTESYGKPLVHSETKESINQHPDRVSGRGSSFNKVENSMRKVIEDKRKQREQIKVYLITFISYVCIHI
jgi:hypothetical protein